MVGFSSELFSVGKISNVSKRFMALFLCLLFLSSIGFSNYNMIVSAQPKKLNYPGPMDMTTAKTMASADARPSVNTQEELKSDGTTYTQPEPLAGVSHETKPKQTPHEATKERTATTSTHVNADGSVTKRQYFDPVFYKTNGNWEDIDTSLIEDKNAGDSGNIAGKALGFIQSAFSATRTYKVKANDWQARFAPSDDSAGMVRIEKGGSQVRYIPKNAKSGVNPVITTDKDGVETIHYYDLWPGVNVAYEVRSDAVKESIQIKEKDATNSFSFKVSGAN